MQIVDIVINKEFKDLNPIYFGEEKCNSGHDFGPIVRDHWFLHFVISGCGIFEDKNGRHNVQAGDMFVIRPNEKTYYKADDTEPWEYIWIGFDANITLPEILENSVIKNIGIAKIFKEMRESRTLGNGKSAFLCSCLWRLMVVLFEQSESKDNYIEKALSYMRSEYINGIGVTQTAQNLGLDRSYFSTLFTKKVGISPSKYLTKLRLERAAELITLHKQKPSTAAISVGYPDIYHFSKMFKKHFGCSPREYQKSFTQPQSDCTPKPKIQI